MSTSKNIHTFPWGVYLGDLIDNGNRLPLYLPSHQGGFNVVFDDISETEANNFIENVSLKLFEALAVSDIVVDVFDFSYKKRFIELAMLKNRDIYHISLSPEEANKKFIELEKISLYRHHELLSPTIKTISDFNQTNQKIESYHLLLINLDYFPNKLSKAKEMKEFFSSAYEVGFYTITYCHKNSFDQQQEIIKEIVDKYPTIEFKNKKITFSKKLFEFYDLTQQYEFKYINDDKSKIIENILNSPIREEEKI
jgi:hypothetical protein